MSNLRYYLVLLLASFSMQTMAQTKDHVYVTGSKCFIIPPKDFVLSGGFSGMQNKTKDASILISVVKKTKEEILSSYNADSLKAKGFSLVEKKDLKVQGKDARLITVFQDLKKTYRQVLVFEDAGSAVVVNSMYTDKSKSLEPEITKSMTSVVYVKDHVEKIQESALFSIKIDESKFKLAKNFYGSLIYTNDGEMNAKSPEKPMLVMALTKNTRPLGDKKEYVSDRSIKNGRVKTATVKETSPINIDGLEGLECITEGVDSKGKKVTSYYAYLFEEKEVYTIQLTDPESKEFSKKTFKEMMATFKRKK